MDLTKDQIEKLCEGFDAENVYDKNFEKTTFALMELSFALGRQYQAKKDVEHAKKAQEHIKNAYMEGFSDKSTYNDVQLNDEEEEFEKSAAKLAGSTIADAIERSIEVKR